MATLEWSFEDDLKNIREGAIELRAKVTQNMYIRNYSTPDRARNMISNDGARWRISAINKIEFITGKKIFGKVIEIGAGTGYFSALLSKQAGPEVIYCLDYDRVSVDELMPLVFKNLDADTSKIKTVLGSYNAMKIADNYFDFVISLGAIHHSENLTATLQECYRVLQPGGFLVASEHCHPNSYSIENQTNDYETYLSAERVKVLYNDETLRVKAKDNSDHYYRLCEFEAHAYSAGFNVLPFVFDINGEKASDSIFINPQPFAGYSNRTFFPYFAKNLKKPIFDNLLLILQKPGGNAMYFRDTNFKALPKKGFFSRLGI